MTSKEIQRKLISLGIIVFFALSIFPLNTTRAQEGGFIENFDNPALPGWEHSQNVFIEGSNLHMETGNFMAHGGDWEIAHISTRIRRHGEGQIVVSYRSSPSGVYFLVIGPDFVLLHRESSDGFIELANNHQVMIPMEEWFHVEIVINGGDHLVLMNGVEVLGTFDDNPLPAGGIGFETLDGVNLEIDELVVSFVSDKDTDAPIDASATTAPIEPTTAADPEVEVESPISTTGEILPFSQLEWIYTGGPPGGLGYDIRYNFEDTNIWYVTDAFAGLFRSTDNGVTWKESSTGIDSKAGHSGDLIPVFSLTVDPHNPNIVWAGTQNSGHIYKSTDYGETWVLKDNNIPLTYALLSFRGFTVDPRTSDIVYAMAETASEIEQIGGQVFRTKNGGESWELIWDGGMPSALARYMWINPENTDVLYVSTGIFDRGAVGPEPYSDITSGMGVLKSTDGGETWKELNGANGLEMLHIGSLYMHPEDPDILLAAAGHVLQGEDVMTVETERIFPPGIYRTTNGGEHWDKVLSASEFRPVEAFCSVELCPSDPNIAYAASLDAVYRSEDAGVTWQVVSSEFGWGPPGVLAGFPIDIQCDPKNPDRLFINNYGGGNFLSEDGGKTWKNASQGYSGAQIISLAVDPNHPGRVFTSGNNSGIWGTHDGGTTWVGLKPENVGFYENGAGAIAVDPGNSDHIISGGRPGFVIFESFDSGDNWKRLWSMDEKGIEFEASEEPMATEQLKQNAVPTSIVFAPSNPQVIYMGGLVRAPLEPFTQGIGVFISKDSGKSWQQSNDSHMRTISPFALAVDPINEDIVYAGTGEGIYKSTDGGDVWEYVNYPGDEMPVFALAVNPQNPDHIIAGFKNEGPFVSQDGGISWKHGVAGWEPNGIPTDILIHPGDPNVVFMSDFTSGVYYSVDGGFSWRKINKGISVKSMKDLALSADGAHLYAGTEGSGIMRLDLFGTPPQPTAPLISTQAQYIGEGAPPIEEHDPDEAVQTDDERITDEAVQQQEDKKVSIPCLGGALPLILVGMVSINKRRK